MHESLILLAVSSGPRRARAVYGYDARVNSPININAPKIDTAYYDGAEGKYVLR